MNFFWGWQLSPLLAAQILNAEEFNNNASQPSSILINIITETEFNASIGAYTFAKQIFTELKPKILYPYSQKSNEYFFIVPNDEPKKLSFENPGQAHKSAYFGAILAQQFVLFPLGTRTLLSFFVHFSDGIKKILSGEQSEFLIGLLQKSITNKIKKSNSVVCQNKTVYFQNSFITREHYMRACAISDSMSYTRTLINMPPNILNPDNFEIILRSLVKHECEKASNPNHIQIEVLQADKLERFGMNLLHAVGKGSESKPRLIKLTYSPKRVRNKVPLISLVGKAITFDSGGYDLKPSSSMRNMKKDMGGAAAVLGVFFSCARMGLPVTLKCFLPIAENMVSGIAMRPGDVYMAKNGNSIEIDNTDAEGRLVLADTICLAQEEAPDWLIDIATLTGAARVSLGTHVDSLFCNNKELSEHLFKIGIETGDWVWPMPLPIEYESYFDSQIADFMNSGSSGFAGSITAALFLQKFIKVDKWTHIDSFMWCDKPFGLWSESAGPTAKCVRLVTKSIEQFISK